MSIADYACLQDSHAKSEASNTSRDSKTAVEKFSKEISKLEKELEQEERELDNIRDSLKGINFRLWNSCCSDILI